MNERADVTNCLNRLRGGDQAAARELASLVYDDLKARAERFVRKSPAAALSATTLVHESYEKMIDGAALVAGGRHEFLALASKIMRDTLVDFARRDAAQKRGGEARRVMLVTSMPDEHPAAVDVLGVHEALEKLGGLDSRLADIVVMRFFGGMTGDEIAEHVGVTRRTVVRELTVAQAWLRKALTERPAAGS